MLGKDKEFEFFGTDWSAKFAAIPNGKMEFHLADFSEFSMNGISFGNYHEKQAMPQKLREHYYKEIDSSSFASESVLPYSSEPCIKRKTDFRGNYARVVTDINIKKGFSAEKLSPDELNIKGEWDRCGLVNTPENYLGPEEIQWFELEKDKNLRIYSSELPFTAILLCSKEGYKLEIGIGDDIWRWMAGNGLGFKSEFTIDFSQGEITISREVIRCSDITEFPVRNWRFTWYFAWETPAFKRIEVAEKAQPVPLTGKCYDDNIRSWAVPIENWPQNAQIRINDDFLKFPCFHSNMVSTVLKKWFRSLVGQGCTSDIVLKCPAPCYCSNSSHLERPGKKELWHWNLAAMRELWFWGNKQLKKQEPNFHIIIDEDYPLTEFPSIKGMALKS